MAESTNTTTNTTESVAIGIDLGTTYSCVGVWKDGTVEIVPNLQGNRITPSWVSFTKEERFIGDAAKNQSAMNPKNSVYDAKRLIGRDFKDPVVQKDIKNWPFTIANVDGLPKIEVESRGETKQFTPQEISSYVLSYLKETAEAYLGKPVTDAVITVPAYFDNSQRQATKDAGAIAGLNVLRIINEPTAAALCYGLGTEKGAKEKKVLIFDLGGGTFDVTVLDIIDGVFDVKATGGDTHLGGEDFDNLLSNFCSNEFKRTKKIDIAGNARAQRRLQSACEKAKRALSSGTTAEINVESLAEGIDFVSNISRAKFEELCSTQFQKCLTTVKNVLKDAKVDKKLIDEIVLVGGSTRIPKIQSMLIEFFDGKELCKSINPDEAVAYGAAIQAAILTGKKDKNLEVMVLLDVTPLSLGIETQGGVMSVIIPRNTTIPCHMSESFTTTEDNQTTITIPVFEGERPQTSQNNLLGTFELTGIPPSKRGTAKIDISLDLDANGILKVTAKDKATGNQNRIVISNNKGRLSDSEIADMIKEAEKNKEADALVRKKVEAKNELEAFAYQLQTSIIDMKNVSIREKEEVNNAITDTINWIDENELADISAVQEKKKELEKMWNPIVLRQYTGRNK